MKFGGDLCYIFSPCVREIVSAEAYVSLRALRRVAGTVITVDCRVLDLEARQRHCETV